jgi:hypothetical protein
VALLPLAEHLAARGVLAVDSLTDDDASDLLVINSRYRWESAAENDLAAQRLRAALRRCATGEPDGKGGKG